MAGTVGNGTSNTKKLWTFRTTQRSFTSVVMQNARFLRSTFTKHAVDPTHMCNKPSTIVSDQVEARRSKHTAVWRVVSRRRGE